MTDELNERKKLSKLSSRELWDQYWKAVGHMRAAQKVRGPFNTRRVWENKVDELHNELWRRRSRSGK